MMKVLINLMVLFLGLVNASCINAWKIYKNKTKEYIEYTTDYHYFSDVDGTWCEKKDGCGMNLTYRKYTSGECKDTISIFYLIDGGKPELFNAFREDIDGTFNKLRHRYKKQTNEVTK